MALMQDLNIVDYIEKKLDRFAMFESSAASLYLKSVSCYWKSNYDGVTLNCKIVSVVNLWLIYQIIYADLSSVHLTGL